MGGLGRGSVLRRSFLFAVAFLVLALSFGAGPGTAHADEEAVCGAKTVEDHKKAAFSTIDHAYRFERWRERSLVTNEHRNHWRGHKECLGDYGRKRVANYRDNSEEDRDRWRKRKAVAWEREQFRKR